MVAELQHNLCFVGNNIRDTVSLNKYLLCTADMGLAIYGNPHGWNSELCLGKISIDNEATLYSSAKICLNAHLTEHLNYGSFNFRIFNILACKGFIISDESIFLNREFSKAIVFTDGFSDLREKVIFYLNNPDKTLPFREYGYQHVLNNHTFKHRTTSIIDWLEKII
jgi:spore maturation protein CgeB